MHFRVRAVLLAGAALVALAPSSGAVALAARSGPARSRAAVGQSLTWAIVPSPNNNVLDNTFTGISCPSASACTAVGYSYGTHSEPKTLIESWNGSAWSIVSSPNPGPGLGQDYLDGVSCPTASSCTAVGYYQKRYGHLKTLIESWNGSTWSVVPSPSPDAGNERLDALGAVSCVSATACTAVGAYHKGILIEIWNGTAWSVVPSPNEGSNGDGLGSVSCAAADACMAVGSYSNTGGPLRTLAESWDGATWSIVPSPNAGGTGTSNQFGGVSCTGPDTCTAVGYSQGTTGPSSTVVESWDGTAWSIVPSPNAGGTNVNSSLLGVSCSSAATCMADGGITHNNAFSHGEKTLAELGTSSG
jgi:hypothetical protein